MKDLINGQYSDDPAEELEAQVKAAQGRQLDLIASMHFVRPDLANVDYIIAAAAELQSIKEDIARLHIEHAHAERHREHIRELGRFDQGDEEVTWCELSEDHLNRTPLEPGRGSFLARLRKRVPGSMM